MIILSWPSQFHQFQANLVEFGQIQKKKTGYSTVSKIKKCKRPLWH